MPHGAAIGFRPVHRLPVHIVQNWRRRANRYSGLALVIVVSLLALSGYGLRLLWTTASDGDSARIGWSARGWSAGAACGVARRRGLVNGGWRLAHRLRPGRPVGLGRSAGRRDSHRAANRSRQRV
jgi:hypothetical protein